ncbi:MAG: orotidine-5'-phosphate decarboxylase [Gemmatimonadota bacterium]|nr:orotidine-5'-phosphate decarboxylase [Gemmatimonadota bacterium]
MTPPLIVALDVPSLSAATALVDRLDESCDFYKVGLELYTAAGPAAVEMLRERRKSVFLDLKLYDIPNTVRGAARAAAGLGATLLSVHASGGRVMLEAAVEGAGAECGVLAVTLLTSLDAAAAAELWGRPVESVEAEVLRLAALAAAADTHGIVCGGPELRAVRGRHGRSLALLVPGIRAAGAPSHDQARTMTADEAAREGASYLVVGRAVTLAADPVAALAELRASITAR